MLEGSEICRILPSSDSGSAVKNRDLSTRPQFWAYATCGFVAENGVCSEVSDYPRTSEITTPHRGFWQQCWHPRQHPAVANTSKGRCRKTEQRAFSVSASRRVSGDCIAENNERVGTRVPLQILARAAYIHFRRVVFHVRQKAHAQPYSSSRFPNEQIAFSIPRRRLPNCLISR